MSSKSRIEIEINQDTLALFDRYHKYTGTTPEQYISQLVEKTLPTIQAMVDAMDEASEQPDNKIDVMDLFARKMAESALKSADSIPR
jgi:hypothetical protein